MEGNSERVSENVLDLGIEFSSFGSWADEVEAEFAQHETEAESESAEVDALKFNPKYAYQAQRLKESLPPSSPVERPSRGRLPDHRPRGEKRSRVSPSNYKRRSYPFHSHGENSRSFSHQRQNEERRSYENQPDDKRRSHSNYTEDDIRERRHYKRSRDNHGHKQDNGYSKHFSSARNYHRERDGLSPLRSPLNSRLASCDNDRRLKRRKPGDSDSKFRTLSGIDEHSDNIGHSNGTPERSLTDLSQVDDDYRGTPIVSNFNWQSNDPSCTRSRRRLCLPYDMADNGDEESVEGLVEDNEERLARREKDVVYGKSTESYQKYIVSIPVDLRDEDNKVHPRTPLKTRKCSRRSWDSQIRLWKRRIHTWAAETNEFLATEQATASSGRRWADVVSGTSADNVESKNGDVKTNLTENEDDESFLDGFELDIINHINDSVAPETDNQNNNSINHDDASSVENRER